LTWSIAGLANREDPLFWVVATKVTELAKKGERDSIRLATPVMKELKG
jgi:hypothetical protein